MTFKMKRKTYILALLCIATLGSGCATPYLVDRGRDAADVFTLSAGKGAGIKARVGPIATGLFAGFDSYGLRGGRVLNGAYPTECPSAPYLPNSIDFTVVFLDISYMRDPDLQPRKKEHSADTVCFLPVNRDIRNTPLSYYTQIEVALGLGVTARFGFNLGELLDFILGWATIDIYSDDLEQRKQKEESNQAIQSKKCSAFLD
jgi:hypothetical protein